MAKKMNNLEKRILTGFIAGSLIFGGAKALAQQQYDACDPANPNYSTECRDESKRDFAKCGEIDYTKVNLAEAGRIIASKYGFPMPDLDPYLDKVAFTGNITNEETDKRGAGRFDIFVSDIHGKNQKRVTWDSNDSIVGVSPFWTKERKIEYIKFNRKSKEKKFYVIDENGNNRQEISEAEYHRFYKDSHDKQGNFNIPPSN